MNVESGTDAAQFIFWEYLFRIFGIVSLQCKSSTQMGSLSVKTQAQNSHARQLLSKALCCMPYSTVMFCNMYKLLIIFNLYCIN